MRGTSEEPAVGALNECDPGQDSLDEKVRPNGNKPISSLSDVAEPHCVSSRTTLGETVPVKRVGRRCSLQCLSNGGETQRFQD